MPTTGSLPVFLAAATAFSSRENDAIGENTPGRPYWWAKFEFVHAPAPMTTSRSFREGAMPDLEIRTDHAGSADTNDVFDIVKIEKLIGVDAHRRHTHTGSHNRDGLAVICSGIALNASDIVYEAGVVEKSFGDILCS